MIKKIGLVGVGSLGSHIAKELQNYVDTIYAVDPDIVEKKNLINSIYTNADINKPKVIALKDNISQCRLIPINADIKNVELPSVDQTIDCRDVVNRNIDTDVKFMVVGKNLRVDCEEPVFTEDENGKYVIDLDKLEVCQAGHLANEVLQSDGILTLQEKKSSIHIPISAQSVDDEIKFLIRQKNKPLLKRDISKHIFNEIKGISDAYGRVKTKLCKIDDQMNIKIRGPYMMKYPQVIQTLNDIVLRQNGTYIINTQENCLEICDPFLVGGA
jgi:hypothetical protein